MNNTIPLDEQLVHDFRPRFNQREADDIETLARRYGMKKNVFVRFLVKRALSNLDNADLFTVLSERTN